MVVHHQFLGFCLKEHCNASVPREQGRRWQNVSKGGGAAEPPKSQISGKSYGSPLCELFGSVDFGGRRPPQRRYYQRVSKDSRYVKTSRSISMQPKEAVMHPTAA